MLLARPLNLQDECGRNRFGSVTLSEADTYPVCYPISLKHRCRGSGGSYHVRNEIQARQNAEDLHGHLQFQRLD